MPASMFKTLPIAAALAVAGLVGAAAQADTVTLNVFAGGAIADGGNAAGTAPTTTPYLFLNLGQTGTVTSVNSLTLDIDHDYAGDVAVRLRYLPNDPTAAPVDAFLFDQINYYDAAEDTIFTLSNVLGGSYSFSSGGTQTLQQAAQPDDPDAVVPSGTYLPSNFYDQVPGTPAIVNLTDAFAGKSLSDGQFVLLITDYYQGSTGTLNSATLSLTTAVPEPTSLAALGLIGAAAVRRRK